MRIKHFFRNINILNLLLFSVVFFMAYYAFPLMHAGIRYTLPSPKKTVIEKAGQTESFNPPSSSSYMIVAEANLFNPERKIPAETKAGDQQQEQPLPKPDVVLHGTLISDGLRRAYVEDLKAPRSTPGRGKRQITMRIGDTISGYTLKKIDTDKIVMARGNDQMTVRIHDRPTPDVSTAQPQTASRVSPRRNRPPSVQSLISPAPPPRRRARMSDAEERARDVFRRLPQ